MNIRSLISQIISPMDRMSPSDSVKAGTASDRDPDGRRERQEKPPRQLTETEIAKLKTHLDEIPGIKEGILKYSFSGEPGHRVLIIENAEGEPVRRFTELEFEALLQSQERPTGKILNRAM